MCFLQRRRDARAAQSHEATRFRERGVRRFNRAVQAQRFLGVHSTVYNLFNLGRHMVRAAHYRYLLLSPCLRRRSGKPTTPSLNH